MTDDERPMSERAYDDVREAVDTMIDASKITRVNVAMSRGQRREFIIQALNFEAKLLENDGNTGLALQLEAAAAEIRKMQPEAKVSAQGLA